MVNKKFAVIDSTNHLVRCFDSYQAADNFRSMNNRFDWIIVSYYPAYNKSSLRQVSAVYFCECILKVSFKGDINDKKECSEFLSKYLDVAKKIYSELVINYKGSFE